MAANDEADMLTLEDRAFARVLRVEREAAGWTQGDLAKRLAARGLSHVSQVTVSRIEHGKRAARLGEAEAIADELGVPLALMTTVDERAEYAKSLMWRVATLRGLQNDARHLAEKLGGAWFELQTDYGYLTANVDSEAYEGVQLPPEAARAVSDFFLQARQALDSPIVDVFALRFEESKQQAAESAGRRQRGAAADAD